METLPNLLIVDDTEENLFFLESVIRKIKVTLIRALSGTEALEKTHGIDLALAIIDVNMPVMNGYELAVRINLTRSKEKVPIIFITASHLAEKDTIKGYDSGAVDYIFKPFNYTFLHSKIDVFLDLYNQKSKISKDAVMLKKSHEALFSVYKALQKSEEKYRNYIDRAPDGVFVTKETGKYIEVNHAASRITGYTKAELLKMSMPDFFPKEYFAGGMASFERLFETGKLSTDMPFRHKNGTIRWWALETVKYDAKRFLLFAKDITRRKHTEEILKNSEENLAEAQRIAHIGSWEWDMTLNTVKWSKEMFRIFDIDAATYDENPEALIKVLHPDDVVSFTNSMRDNLSEGKSLVLEYRVIHRDGSVHHMLASGRVYFNEAGKPNKSIGTVLDITERKHAEDALRKSETLFKSVVNNNHDLTTLTDKDGRTIFLSPQCENVLGYPPEVFLGKQFPNIIHPDDNERCKLKWEQVLNEGLELKEYEYRIVDSSGATRWVSHSAKMVTIDESILGMQNNIRDITPQKKAQDAIKVSEGKYRTMLNASPDGIFLINMDGMITEVSDIGLELFGADTKHDLVGMDFSIFVPADEKKSVTDIFERTINEGLTQNIGLKITKKNQSVFAAEISATLIQGPDGVPLSFMFIIRDISMRKKMETKQIHADRMANLGQMAAGIAHEINQPLNIISMVVDKILFESAKTDSINLDFFKKKADKIFENITRMKNIIDHIRAFSRSQEEYVSTAFDINTSIENATSMIAEQFKHLGINLNIQRDIQIPQISGNTYKFEQVVLKLLVNAKDALIEKKNKQPDFTEMTIDIKTYSENRFLIVEVADNGIGISSDDIQHIILPFYTTKDEGKGTGLGLTICYQIIKEMGGTIEIISDGIQGTKIKLLLEIQKDNHDVNSRKN